MALVTSSTPTQQEHSWASLCPVHRTGTGSSVEYSHNFEESIDEATNKIFKKIPKPKRMISWENITIP